MCTICMLTVFRSFPHVCVCVCFGGSAQPHPVGRLRRGSAQSSGLRTRDEDHDADPLAGGPPWMHTSLPPDAGLLQANPTPTPGHGTYDACWKPTPACGQNNKCLWKHYFPQTSLAFGKMLLLTGIEPGDFGSFAFLLQSCAFSTIQW